MAFRKRNIAVGRSPNDTPTPNSAVQSFQPGVKPSSITSHPVTSTGTPSLDTLLGGHGGLVQGCSLLIEESGTTDFSGALLKYFAAEGICQGHVLHVVGVGNGWVRELPGLAEERASKGAVPKNDDERMKIAWRYERSGQAGERGAWTAGRLTALTLPSKSSLPDRSISSTQSGSSTREKPFCHTFDLSKRLIIPRDAAIHHYQIAPSDPIPFDSVIRQLESTLQASAAKIPHRLVIPTILSPALYPPQASRPENFIRFLHSLRALLRKHPNMLTAMISLPLELYPRTSALVRWTEILSDGVLELTPFPHLMDASNSLAESGGARSNDDQPQGMFKVHKLPINTERGEGGAGAGNTIGEDLAFTVSRRKFVIKPFSLPPMDGDQEAQKEAGKITAKDVEF